MQSNGFLIFWGVPPRDPKGTPQIGPKSAFHDLLPDPSPETREVHAQVIFGDQPLWAPEAARGGEWLDERCCAHAGRLSREIEFPEYAREVA